MKNFTLKKTGRIFLIIIAVLSSVSLAGQAIKTEIEDNRIEAGESTVLKISIPGEIADIKPLTVPTVKGLSINYTGPGMVYQNINGRVWKGVVLSYSITSRSKGKYRIPPFVFDVRGSILKSDEQMLLVTSGPAGGGGGGAREDVKGFSDLQISKKSVYLGEPLLARYYLLTTGIKSVKFKGLSNQPDYKGFVVKEFSESLNDDIVKYNGADHMRSHLVSFLLIPAETGNLKAGGGTLNVIYDVARSFGFMNSTNIEFEAVNIKVLPLPVKGKPPDFRGDVGSFKITASYSPEAVGLYQEKKINITVSGTGNLVTMTRPNFEKSSDSIKVIIEEKENRIDVKDNILTGEKKFIYSIITQKAGETDLGRAVLSYFNPLSKKYERTESGPVNFQVTGENDLRGDSREKFESGKEKGVEISPILLAVTALVLGGITMIILWERKRLRLAGAVDDVKEGAPLEKSKEPDFGDYLVKLKKAVLVKNDMEFMLLAEKALASADRIFRSAGEPSAEVIKLKDELYDFRYGGAAITEEKMGLIFKELEAIHIKCKKV